MGMVLDLILIHRPNNERSMMAVLVPDESAEPILLGPYPSKGAFGPLAKELNRLSPTNWPNEDSAIWDLTLIHFQNMHNQRNLAGQSYPLEFP